MKADYNIIKKELRSNDRKFREMLKQFRRAAGETRAKLLEDLIQLVDTSEQLKKLEKWCRTEEINKVHMDLNCAW